MYTALESVGKIRARKYLNCLYCLYVIVGIIIISLGVVYASRVTPFTNNVIILAFLLVGTQTIMCPPVHKKSMKSNKVCTISNLYVLLLCANVFIIAYLYTDMYRITSSLRNDNTTQYERNLIERLPTKNWVSIQNKFSCCGWNLINNSLATGQLCGSTKFTCRYSILANMHQTYYIIYMGMLGIFVFIFYSMMSWIAIQKYVFDPEPRDTQSC